MFRRTGADTNSFKNFNCRWIYEFKKKKPMPTKCGTAVVSDIGLRLSEGLHNLQLDQQLATSREVGRR